MSEKMIIVIINAFTFLVLLIAHILTIRISRKNILLGVRIPEEKLETDEVKEIKKGFLRENIIVGFISLLIISLFIYRINSENLIAITVFLYLAILFLVYARWNKKVKDLKKQKEWYKLEDDDKYWKLANSIYYNPNDSSVLVGKRVGIGWTVNTGRPLGMFIMVLTFIIIAIILIFIR